MFYSVKLVTVMDAVEAKNTGFTMGTEAFELGEPIDRISNNPKALAWGREHTLKGKEKDEIDVAFSDGWWDGVEDAMLKSEGKPNTKRIGYDMGVEAVKSGAVKSSADLPTYHKAHEWLEANPNVSALDFITAWTKGVKETI
jgi:hypothetical protein